MNFVIRDHKSKVVEDEYKYGKNHINGLNLISNAYAINDNKKKSLPFSSFGRLDDSSLHCNLNELLERYYKARMFLIPL